MSLPCNRAGLPRLLCTYNYCVPPDIVCYNPQISTRRALVDVAALASSSTANKIRQLAAAVVLTGAAALRSETEEAGQRPTSTAPPTAPPPSEPPLTAPPSFVPLTAPPLSAPPHSELPSSTAAPAAPVAVAEIKDAIHEAFPHCSVADEYAAIRTRLRQVGGAPALRGELEALGFVSEGKLTTGTKPFNVFARVAAGVMLQSGMQAETASLGAASERFLIACNRPENDENWESAAPEWVGKASMGQRHRFMLVRDLSWSLFNVAAFGLQSGAELTATVEMLEAMEAAALLYVSKTAGWSNNLGMYFHVYGHASVNALHLHLVDLDVTGPTFKALAYKNLPLQAVLEVLRTEASSVTSSVPVVAVPPAMVDEASQVREAHAKGEEVAAAPSSAARSLSFEDILICAPSAEPPTEPSVELPAKPLEDPPDETPVASPMDAAATSASAVEQDGLGQDGPATSAAPTTEPMIYASTHLSGQPAAGETSGAHGASQAHEAEAGALVVAEAGAQTSGQDGSDQVRVNSDAVETRTPPLSPPRPSTQLSSEAACTPAPHTPSYVASPSHGGCTGAVGSSSADATASPSVTGRRHGANASGSVGGSGSLSGSLPALFGGLSVAVDGEACSDGVWVYALQISCEGKSQQLWKRYSEFRGTRARLTMPIEV